MPDIIMGKASCWPIQEELNDNPYSNQYIASFKEYNSELGLLDWADLDEIIGYKIDLVDTPEEGKLVIVAYGEKGYQAWEIQSKSTTITFDKSLLGGNLTFFSLQSKHPGLYTVKVDTSMVILRSEPYEKRILGWDHHLCDVTYLRKQFVNTVSYDELWSELNIFYDEVPLKLKNYKGIRLELAEATDKAHIKVYGDGEQKEDYLPLTGTSTTIMFNTDIFSSEINRVTLQYTNEAKGEAKVISAWLIRQDDTEEYSDLSPFWGCEITNKESYVTAIKDIKADKPHTTRTDSRIYNLAGQRLSKPQKGINIIDGKKVVIK